MTPKAHFFPLGNADCSRLDLADGRMVLVDYAAMRDPNDPEDRCCDLASELRGDLQALGRKAVDVVCVTHVDKDHCRGFGDFFRLRHRPQDRSEHLVDIDELWVPAVAVLETGLEDDASLVQREARHRLREGSGVRVFSRPQRLEAWMRDQGLDPAARARLIVDAGTTVPGFSLEGAERCEFFVHSPFGHRQDDGGIIDRNENSIVMQATLVEGKRPTRILLASDVDHEALAAIVQITRVRGRDDRLSWDLMKLPHHCSYTAIGPDRGSDETAPTEDMAWLYEERRAAGSVIVSPSEPIPTKGTEEDRGKQPPHRQAAAYHRRISERKDGRFLVTTEEPSKARPKRFAYTITPRGLAPALAAPSAAAAASASSPRAGR